MRKLLMRKTGFLVLIQFSALLLVAQGEGYITEKQALRAVQKDNIEVVEKFLEQGNDINGYYGRQNTTLLNHAINKRSESVFDLLIEKGANPDLSDGRRTPLVSAIRRRNLMMVHKLIQNGAEVDLRYKGGNTALIYAARNGRLRFVKSLIEYGANAEISNNSGQTALDLANMTNYREVAQYLVKVIELRHFFANIAPNRDGPHIEWVDDTLVRMFYMVTDPKKKYPVMHRKYIPVTSDTTILQGFAGDTLQYKITKQYSTDQYEYKNIGKILALGDVHGEYDAFRNYLISNGVIDRDHNWTWGDGHLVLLGDLFDRGNRVTETLWLIHQLDLKSREHGGQVHLLLGNHEIMVMINDIRYVSEKYMLFSNYFFRSYASFYDRNTELGRWLRSRNVIIRIDDHVFSHAGISSTIKDNNFTLERLNFLVQNFLADEPKAPNLYAKETNIVLGKFGPLWYRGYLYDFPDVSLIQEDQVSHILDFLGAKKMVIAHSEVKSISLLFNQQVIAIDVPIHPSDIISEGLLIENGRLYRLLYNGEKIPLKAGIH
jgi:hypothetical protein